MKKDRRADSSLLLKRESSLQKKNGQCMIRYDDVGSSRDLIRMVRNRKKKARQLVKAELRGLNRKHKIGADRNLMKRIKLIRGLHEFQRVTSKLCLCLFCFELLNYKLYYILKIST